MRSGAPTGYPDAPARGPGGPCRWGGAWSRQCGEGLGSTREWLLALDQGLQSCAGWLLSSGQGPPPCGEWLLSFEQGLLRGTVHLAGRGRSTSVSCSPDGSVLRMAEL